MYQVNHSIHLIFRDLLVAKQTRTVVGEIVGHGFRVADLALYWGSPPSVFKHSKLCAREKISVQIEKTNETMH